MLEEVPDIDYTVIGGLGSQIEAIRDAVELPFLHKELFDEHELQGRRRASCSTGRRAAARP